MIATIFQKLFRRDTDPKAVARINKVLARVNLRTISYIGGLVFLTILAFGISVDGFFVADDMWQVNYAHKVFNGRLDLIWLNFTSNYLQLPSFDFYRPLMGFTVLFDYALYRTSSIGYHVTNIFLYECSVVLLFILLRRMTRTWPENNSQSVSYLGAALFAVSPLHCEDVCWISGRADLLCAPFYLLALWCVVKSHQDKVKKFYGLGVLFFILAMFSKEIGIGLPLVIAAYYFTWPNEDTFGMSVDIPKFGSTKYQQDRVSRHKVHLERVLKDKRKKKKKKEEKRKKEEEEALEESLEIEGGEESTETEMSFKDRLVFALKMSSPFVGAALVYLFIRYLALGTIVGGYSGVIGGSLNQHLVFRWGDLSYLWRIVIPIPEMVLSQSDTPLWAIGISLILCCVVALIRVYAQSDPRKWLFFLSVWMLSCVLPLFKLWGVGEELETSRLLFFFTMGYSALFPVLMFYPPKADAGFKFPKSADKALGIMSAALLSTIIVAMAWVSFSTSMLWVIGGQEMKKVWQKTIALVNTLKKNERVMVLGIPKDFHGAHISFNGSTFHILLRPPFVSKSISRNVITFEPFVVGAAEVFNTTRFKIQLAMPGLKGLYFWDRQKNDYQKVRFGGELIKEPVLKLPFEHQREVDSKLPSWKYSGQGKLSQKDDLVIIKDTLDGDALKFEGLNLSPFSFDLFEIDLAVEREEKDLRKLVPLALSWNHQSTEKDRGDWVLIALKPDNLAKVKTIKLRASHYWRWYSAGKIDSFVLRLPDKVSLKIKEIRLVKGEKQTPILTAVDRKLLVNGEFLIEEDKPVVEVMYDASMVEGAKAVEVQLSEPNYFFDNNLMSLKNSALKESIINKATSGKIVLDPKLTEKPAYYQIRMRALDSNNESLGVWSDSITLLKLGKGIDNYVH